MQSSAGMGVQASGDEIHPVFGFSALSSDTDPPVEPDHEVQALIRERDDGPLPEFFFEPTGLAIEPGDVVKFTMATPEHTVTAYHPSFGRTQRVPDGVAPVSSPVLGGGAYWLYRFSEEGVYDMFCGPHEVFGMVVRLVVGEPTGPGAEPVPAPFGEAETTPGGDTATTTTAETTATESMEGPPLRPPDLTAALVLRDSALAPEAVVSATRVSWEDIEPENKQLLIQITPPE